MVNQGLFSAEDHAVFTSPLQPLSSLARSDKSDTGVKILENLIPTKQENRWMEGEKPFP